MALMVAISTHGVGWLDGSAVLQVVVVFASQSVRFYIRHPVLVQKAEVY